MRWAARFLCAASLALLVAAAWLWVRSYRLKEELLIEHRHGERGHLWTTVGFCSEWGEASVWWDTQTVRDLEGRPSAEGLLMLDMEPECMRPDEWRRVRRTGRPYYDAAGFSDLHRPWHGFRPVTFVTRGTIRRAKPGWLPIDRTEPTTTVATVLVEQKFLQVPFWSVAAAVSLPPGAVASAALLRRRRLSRRRRLGLCPRCGYDLRGGPGRCPECGAVPTARPPRSATVDGPAP